MIKGWDGPWDQETPKKEGWVCQFMLLQQWTHYIATDDLGSYSERERKVLEDQNKYQNEQLCIKINQMHIHNFPFSFYIQLCGISNFIHIRIWNLHDSLYNLELFGLTDVFCQSGVKLTTASDTFIKTVSHAQWVLL